jgi:uncharacterized protein (DUF362 family)
VGEDGFGGDAESFMRTLGITAAVGSDATCVNLANYSPPDEESPNYENYTDANTTAWPDGIDFYKAVRNAHYVINVPRCKTHGIAQFTLALKAWYGCVRRPSSRVLHADGGHEPIAQAHWPRQEDLVVIDATRSMITGGPSSGTMADSRIVVVTEDAIAADVTGVAILRHSGAALAVPWTINQIRRAMAQNYPAGWLTEQTDFSYSVVGDIPEAAEIMAARSA